MSVTIIPPRSQTGETGVGRYATNVIEHLPDDLDVTVRADPRREFTLFGRTFGGYLTRWLGNLKPVRSDVVHSMNVHQYHRSTNVWTIHDLVAYHKPERYGLGGTLWRLLANAVETMDAVITPTRYIAGQVLTEFGIPEDRVHVVPHGINHALYSPTPTTPTEPGKLLMVGDVRPRKRAHEIAHAARHLDDVTLHRAGPEVGNDHDGYEADFRDLTDRLDNYVDHGYVPLHELVHHYRTAELLVYPSEAEGFGLPPLEAAACGTPTLTSTHPVFAETLAKYRHVWRPDQPLHDAIQDALLDPVDEHSLIQIASRFRWEDSAQRHAEIYREVAQ